jgi:hypothetical protein
MIAHYSFERTTQLLIIVHYHKCRLCLAVCSLSLSKLVCVYSVQRSTSLVNKPFARKHISQLLYYCDHYIYYHDYNCSSESISSMFMCTTACALLFGNRLLLLYYCTLHYTLYCLYYNTISYINRQAKQGKQ